MLILRLVHVLFGVFWAGTIFFIVLYLEPAVRGAGPDGAKVMRGIQDRKILTVLPIAALLTILSGIDLYRRVSANFNPGWIHSSVGMTYSIGAIAAFVAFVIGIAIMRPATIKAGTLAASLATMDETDRAPAEATIAILRTRSRIAARWVAALLLVAVLTMAGGRYM